MFHVHIHLIRWLLDFIGVHNGENQFSTRMYNFWSGFGGNISVLALLGVFVGIYRQNVKRLQKLERLNPLHIAHLGHKKEESKND